MKKKLGQNRKKKQKNIWHLTCTWVQKVGHHEKERNNRLQGTGDNSIKKKMQQQWIQGPWKQVAWGHDIILTVLILSSGIGM